MPPVMEPMEDKKHVYLKDEMLQGYVDQRKDSNYNLVFTDISSGYSDRVGICRHQFFFHIFHDFLNSHEL